MTVQELNFQPFAVFTYSSSYWPTFAPRSARPDTPFDDGEMATVGAGLGAAGAALAGGVAAVQWRSLRTSAIKRSRPTTSPRMLLAKYPVSGANRSAYSSAAHE